MVKLVFMLDPSPSPGKPGKPGLLFFFIINKIIKKNNRRGGGRGGGEGYFEYPDFSSNLNGGESLQSKIDWMGGYNSSTHPFLPYIRKEGSL